MSHRFYINAELTCNSHIELTETVFHHWVKVLRAKINDQAILFNGHGGEYTATLTEINKKTALVHIGTQYDIDRIPQFNALLGQVMSKGDRMDYAIQKAVELGVKEIQLLSSERCEMRLKYDRDQKKIEHWRSIAIAACEQSGLNRVPQIHPPISVDEWIKTDLPTTRLVLAPNKSANPTFEPNKKEIVLLIGPEGGLSDTEIIRAEQHGFKRWCIGERVLRTETAPVVALSILNFIFK